MICLLFVSVQAVCADAFHEYIITSILIVSSLDAAVAFFKLEYIDKRMYRHSLDTNNINVAPTFFIFDIGT